MSIAAMFVPATVSLALATATVGMQTPPARTGLHFVAAATNSYDVEYVAPPNLPGNYVLFVGEVMELRISLGNRGDVDQTVTIGEVPIGRAVLTRGLRIPAGGSVPRVLVQPVGRVIDGQNVSTVNWEGELHVPSRGTLEFPATVVVPDDGPPGLYEFETVPGFAATTAPIVPLGTGLRFELRRALSSEDRVEMVRRRMRQSFNRGDLAGAEEAADKLLTMYPSSSAAYQLKGEVAEERGQRQRAISQYQRALELLSSGQDKLWLAHAPTELATRRIDALTRTIESASRVAPVVDKHQ
jgi:hypothetical protein